MVELQNINGCVLGGGTAESYKSCREQNSSILKVYILFFSSKYAIPNQAQSYSHASGYQN